MLRPKLRLESRPSGEVRVKDYKVRPLNNLFFTRDSCITTDVGVVIANMSEPARLPETQVVKLALSKLGITPIAEIQEPGKLEGGDFIPAGKAAFIGVGIRTNDEAVEELLNRGACSYDRVVLVRDPLRSMAQMHLDTYFNVVGPNKVLLREARLTVSAERPTVDVYSRQRNGTYRQSNRNQDFIELLKNMNFQILPVSDVDQQSYGVNVLCVAENRIVGSTQQRTRYYDLFRYNRVAATFVRMDNIRLGYGSNRCMTQVLSRTQ